MGAGRTEFELKFTGASAELAKLPQSRFFAAVSPEGGAWERLTSTYYDTPDGALAARELSLRLREEGAGLIQALKKSGGEIASGRREFETAIDSADEFPVPVGEVEIDSFLKSAAGALQPIASTRADRWSSIIKYKRAEIELSVDLGQAESWDEDRRAFAGPLAEVELELIAGDRADIFDFARLLLDNAPLRFSAGSKLDYALSRQMTAGPIPKPKRLDIGGETNAADMFAAVLLQTAARLASLHPEVTEMRRPEGVHQMRVALRRFRAAERIIRRHMEGAGTARLASTAKQIASALGPARDWDVFLAETLPAAFKSNYSPDALGLLKAKAEARRAAAWARAVETISDPQFTHFLLDLTEAGVERGWREEARKPLQRQLADYAPRALDRALKKAKEAAEEARSAQQRGQGPAALHPLRIALKKLRYPAQLFRGLYPKQARQDYMSALSALQTKLGAMNDAVTAQHLADQAAAGGGEAAIRAAGFISGYKAAEAQIAVKEIDAAIDAFEKMRPFWRDR